MIEPLHVGENLENPFAPSIEHYESIVAFMKDAKKWAHNFMKAIPENPETDKIMFWNDTATNPAVRFEFHVITNKETGEFQSITYQVKVNRKGEPVFIVTMERGTPKKFSDEKEALELVTVLYKTIRGIE